MQPQRPLPTVSFVREPLRRSPNAHCDGDRGIMARWFHVDLRSLLATSGRWSVARLNQIVKPTRQPPSRFVLPVAQSPRQWGASRNASRPGWKMVQTAGAAIPALAWGLNPPEWQDSLLQTLNRLAGPCYRRTSFSQGAVGGTLAATGPRGPVRAIPFFGRSLRAFSSACVRPHGARSR